MTEKSCKTRRSSEKGGYSSAPRAHVVVGTVVNNSEEASAKWATCDLERVLVRQEDLAHDIQSTSIRTFSNQKHLY